MIDPVESDSILDIEGVRCYNATTNVYYLNVNNRYLTSILMHRLKDTAFQSLTHELSRGKNINIATVDILNSRLISPSTPFIIPDLEKKNLSKESVFAPVLVSTNVRKLALGNKGAADMSAASGHPLYVLYAHMQRSILSDPTLFRRLCFYPQKGNVCSLI
jgi:hypothetical protein